MTRLLEYRDSIVYFLKARWFFWPILLVTILSFGYRMVNPTLSNDDLGADFYFNQGGILAQGRWSQYLIYKVFNLVNMNSSIINMYAVLCIFVSVFLFVALIRMVSGNSIHPIAYFAFGSYFISYPLVVEIAMFDGGFFFVGLGYLVTPIILMCTQGWFLDHKRRYLLVASILMTILLPLYESFATVYFLASLMLLTIAWKFNDKEEIGFLQNIKNIMIIMIPLLIGITANGIINFSIHQIIQLPASHSSNGIVWSSAFLHEGKELVYQFINQYIFNAFAYLPLMILIIAVLLQMGLAVIHYLREKQPYVFFIPLVATVSLFTISIVSGRIQAYRMNTNFALYVAFTALMITQIVVMHKSLFLKVFALLFLGIGLVWQVNDINKWFFVEELRYQQDLAIVREIGTRLEREFDVQKPVVFVGNNEFDDTIKEFLYVPNNSLAGYLHNEVAGLDRIDWEYSYQITQTAIHTYFNWANTAYYTREYVSQTYAFFHYFGYDNLIRDNRENQGEIAEKLGDPSFWVTDDYIMETDRFVIVNFDRY